MAQEPVSISEGAIPEPAAGLGPETGAPAPGSAPTPGPGPPIEPVHWRQSNFAWGFVRTARPRQWIKNVLVFAAPGAAGIALEPDTLGPVVAAFFAWCMVSSGCYFLNDALDAEADRHHPRKRIRPVAAGLISVRLAMVTAVGLLVVGIGAPLTWGAPGVSGLLALYTAITMAYSFWLKEEPVIDLACVASGFVLRAISGGVAADVPISNWFIIVASFGSLFMVAGKRHAEHVDLREGRGAHRATLDEYSLSFLGYVRSVSSGVAIAAYCLWAFEKAEASSAAVAFQLSIIPFVIALFRYALVVDAGRGGEPEQIVLGDRTLQAIGLVWIACFAVGVYAG